MLFLRSDLATLSDCQMATATTPRSSSYTRSGVSVGCGALSSLTSLILDGAQPVNDGQAEGKLIRSPEESHISFKPSGMAFEDKVGFGQPTENP